MRPGCLIGLAPRKNGTICGRQVVLPAADIDKTALHQISRSIPQIALHVCVGIVLPHSQGVREFYGRSDIVGCLPLEVILDGMVDVTCTERLDSSIGRVCSGESPGYMCAPTSHYAGRDKRGRKGNRLAVGIKMVVIEPERQIVIAMAKVSRIPLALIGILRAVKIESLPGSLRIR